MMNSTRPLLDLVLFCVTFSISLLVNAHADAPITAIAIAPDGKQVLIGSQRGIEIRTWPELIAVNMLPSKLSHIHDLRFSPSGQQLLVAGGAPAESGEIEVWSWPGVKELSRAADHSDVVYRVAWSPDGTRWASCGGDSRCFVYSEKSEKRTQYDGHSQPVCSIRWLDDRTLASVGVDQTVRLWNAETGEHLRTLDNHVGSVNDLAMRPAIVDSDAGSMKDILATVSEDRTVRLWQPRVGRLVRFTRLTSVPRAVVWSADAERLIIGCNDGKVLILDWESMELVEEADGLVGRIHELVLDPASKFLLVAGERGFRYIEANFESN
jgi:WD40 repeat protein